MKTKLLFKSLLVAAGLCVGQSAWADVTPYSESYSSTSETTGWSTGTGGRFTPVILDEEGNYYLSVNQGQRNNNGATVTGTVLAGKAAAGDDFTLMFDMRLGGHSDGTKGAASLTIKDAAGSSIIFSLTESGTSTSKWLVNSSATEVTLPNSGANAKTDGTAITGITWCSYKISRSGSLTYLTITNKETSETILERTAIDNASATGGLGNVVFSTSRYNANFAIDNIVVRELESSDVPAVTPVNYTIKYRNESSVKIADDVVIASYVGAEVTASAAQMNSIVYNAQKYIYKSGNDDITLVSDEASNVITLVYREAATYTYKLASDCLGTVFANSSDFEGNTVYVPYPKYELKDNVLYLAAGGNNGDYFRDKYTLMGNVDETKAYTVTDINNVVFYIEGENIAGASINDNERSADIRNSNGATGYAAGIAGENDLVITTLPAGTYKIVANVHTSTSAGGSSTFILGDNSFVAVGAVSQQNTEKTSEEFTVTSSTELKLQAGGGKTNSLDYVYVIQTATPVTIASSGYSSIASAYALDCAHLPAGLEAYKVTSITASAVTLEQVNEAVAPGTGLILKGTASTPYNIPVVATGSDISATNKLKAAVTATTLADGSFYILKSGEFHKVIGTADEDARTIPAGKAYLLATDVPSEAPALNFVFAGSETTGINAVNGSQSMVKGSQVYNLAGQRVAQPTRGLYIVNGKKVVVK